MFEKLSKKLVNSSVGVVKQKATKCLDDHMDLLVGIASVAFILLYNMLSAKTVSHQIVINNTYNYLGRR